MRNATASVVGRRWPPRPDGRRECENKYENRVLTVSPFTVIILSYVYIRYVYRGNWSAAPARRNAPYAARICGRLVSVSVFPPSSSVPSVFYFIFQFERTYPFLDPLYGSRTTDRPTWLENPCWCTSTIWWVLVLCYNRTSWDRTNPTARCVIKTISVHAQVSDVYLTLLAVTSNPVVAARLLCIMLLDK